VIVVTRVAAVLCSVSFFKGGFGMGDITGTEPAVIPLMNTTAEKAL
jgi:hypothetical protein